MDCFLPERNHNCVYSFVAIFHKFHFFTSLHVNSRSYWLRETKAGSDKNGSNYLRFFCYKYLDVIYNGEAIITGLRIPYIFWT